MTSAAPIPGSGLGFKKFRIKRFNVDQRMDFLTIPTYNSLLEPRPVGRQSYQVPLVNMSGCDEVGESALCPTTGVLLTRIFLISRNNNKTKFTCHDRTRNLSLVMIDRFCLFRWCF